VVASHRGMQQHLVWLRRVAELAGERGVVRRGVALSRGPAAKAQNGEICAQPLV